MQLQTDQMQLHINNLSASSGGDIGGGVDPNNQDIVFFEINKTPIITI